MSGELKPRWLNRKDAATYIGVKEHQLPRLVRSGKIPAPSTHLGPRNPRYDREALDRAFGLTAISSHREKVRVAANVAAQRGHQKRRPKPDPASG